MVSICDRNAIESAQALVLDSDLEIRAIAASAFIATKWEAFASRGAANMLVSHDVEDIITVVAGRPSIVTEARDSPRDVRTFIIDQTKHLLDDLSAEEIVEDALPDARSIRGLVEEVMGRLRTPAI